MKFLINLNMQSVEEKPISENENNKPLILDIKPKDFANVCRTCLKDLTQTESFNSIFDRKLDGLLLEDAIKEYITIEIKEDDGLPRNICMACEQELTGFATFKKKCIEYDVALKDILLNYEESIHEENDDDDYKEVTIVPDILDGDSDINCSSEEEKEPVRRTRTRTRKRKKCAEKNESGKKSYNCVVCKMKFEIRRDLVQHKVKENHMGSPSVSCEVCQKVLSKGKLQTHMRTHTQERPYKCEKCPRVFTVNGNLKRHMMTHTGERPHVCEICGKGFIQLVALQKHLNFHKRMAAAEPSWAPPSFFCNICGRGFKRRSRYVIHLKKHKLTLTEEGEPKEVNNVDDDCRYFCEVCHKGFNNKYVLKQHLVKHGERKFLCSECGKGFFTKAALQSHFRIHSGEKPHVCQICKKSFAHSGSYDSHMLIHTGFKPYTCIVCERPFTQRTHLNYHMRTHSGEKPYVCSYCGKAFALNGNLTVHVRTHTGETPYLCNICGKGFHDSSTLRKHRKNHKEVESEKSEVIVITNEPTSLTCQPSEQE